MTTDPRIPALGAVSQAERMFIVNWIANEWHEGGAPRLSPDFVARQGRNVRLIDLRAADEMPGEVGYVPGVDWLPGEEVAQWRRKLDPKQPIVLISRSGGEAVDVAKQLTDFPLRAIMQGGMWAWRELGFDVSHDRKLERGAVRPITPVWEAKRGILSLDDVKTHLGDPFSTRWIKLAALMVHGRVSCVDGRDATGVLGTPGGDAGEFIMALAAVEHVTRKEFTQAEIAELLARRNRAFGRFYIHTDVHASNDNIKSMRADKRMDAALKNVFEPLEWRRFYSTPPQEVRDVVLEHALQPGHIGCGHLRMMFQRPSDYGVRGGLVKDALRAIYMRRWSGDSEVEINVLPSDHAEGGVLSVVLDHGVQGFSRIPLVSPLAGHSQMFINHPQVSDYLRSQQAHFLAAQDDLLHLTSGQAHDVERILAELGARQAAQTLGALAKGLPVYEARFARDHSVDVRQIGEI